MAANTPVLLWNREVERPYALILTFLGPGASSDAEQRDRKDTVRQENLCSTLTARYLDTALARPTARVAVLYAAVPALGALPPDLGVGPNDNPLPDALRAKLRGRPGTALRRRQDQGQAVGMYVMDEDQPCVLQYVCVGRDFQRYGFGLLLLRHFELQRRAPPCRRLYLAAVRAPGVTEFYARHGWMTINVAAEMESPVADPANPINGPVTMPGGVQFTVYPDTVVMAKDVGSFAAPSEPPDPPPSLLPSNLAAEEEEEEDQRSPSADAGQQ